jgi:hypothetical protein
MTAQIQNLGAQKQRFGISLLVIMENILAKFLRAHQQHEAWWFKIKIIPNADSNEAWPLDEAPGEYCLSKLLGISMNDLWEVLIASNLAKKRGKRNIIDEDGVQQFITDFDNRGEQNPEFGNYLVFIIRRNV